MLRYIYNIITIKLYLHATATVSSTENNRYNNYIITNRLQYRITLSVYDR